MSNFVEGTACGAEGCEIAESRIKPVSTSAAITELKIQIISDAICPWCWVAKRRIERALAALKPAVTATIAWRPFELNREMPKAGLDRRAYRSRKFGSWEHSQALDAQVASVAKEDGLEFRHQLIQRTPNTLDAHRLIWLAGQKGDQNAVVEGVFSAYFHEGRDIGIADVLADVGAANGLDRAGVSAMLNSDEGLNEVAAELDRATRLQVSGVPTVLVNGRPLFSGAIRCELMEVRLREAAGYVG